MTSETIRSGPRRDADRNRSRIVEAARAVLETNGDAPMHTMAKAAGVGQGTLYRHFPTREALVLAVHREDVGGLLRSAPELLEQHRGAEALRRWLGELAQYGRAKHGLASAFQSATHGQLAAEGYGPVVDAIDLLLAAGVEDETLRADVSGADVLVLVSFLWRLDLDDDRDERAARLLDVTMDALVAR